MWHWQFCREIVESGVDPFLEKKRETEVCNSKLVVKGTWLRGEKQPTDSSECISVHLKLLVSAPPP